MKISKVELYKVFLDLDVDDEDNMGCLEFLVKGTQKEISGFLYKKYPLSNFTMEKMPPLITFNKFRKVVNNV